MSKEKRKGEGTILAISFFHSVIIFRINAWWIHGCTVSEKGHDGLPWSFGFWNSIAFFLHLKQALFQCRAWRVVSASPGPVVETACCPCICSAHPTPSHNRSNSIRCFLGVAGTICKLRDKKPVKMHITGTSSAYIHTPVSHRASHTKYKFKIKIFKISR